MTIAEKYAAQYLPNGEVGLADLIQAAIDEATHMMHRAAEMDAGTISILQERIRQLEAQSVAVVGEVVAYQLFDAGKWHNFINDRHYQNTVSSGCKVRALVVQPTHSIPAAELEALREKAAFYDWLKCHAKTIEWREKDEFSGTKRRPSLDDDIRAAIARGPK